MVQQSSSRGKTCDSLENQRQNYKKILGRTRKFQVYLNQMSHVISNHAVKVAGLRDKNDELAKCLDGFTKVEEFSTTSKLAMAVAAELMATIGDHQDLSIQRIETMVLPNLSSYGRICDCVKADLWKAIQAIKREKAKRKSANLLRKKTKDPKVKKAYDDAMRELERASADTSRLCQLSQEQVIKFEYKRLMDLKESIGNFLKIQIATHTKSLELLSQTFKHIQSIDEDGDLNILITLLKLSEEGKTSCKKKIVSLKGSKSSLKILKAKEMQKKKITNLEDSETESSSSDYTTDSSHSEIVRHIENVLRSSSRGGTDDGGAGDSVKISSSKPNLKGESKHGIGENKTNTGGSGSKDGYGKKSSNVEVKSRTSSLSGEIQKHSSHFKSKEKVKPEKVKEEEQDEEEEKDEEDDSDSYVPVKSKTPKASSAKYRKRPSTPPRALTVPTRMSSPEPEEPSTSRADPSFEFRGNPIGSHRRTKMGDYSYSMSEEEKTRALRMDNSSRRHQNLQGEVKHVSFNSNNPNPRARPQHDYNINQNANSRSYNQNQVQGKVQGQGQSQSQGQQYTRSVYSDNIGYYPRETQVLFPPVKSSLKKYC